MGGRTPRQEGSQGCRDGPFIHSTNTDHWPVPSTVLQAGTERHTTKDSALMVFFLKYRWRGHPLLGEGPMRRHSGRHLKEVVRRGAEGGVGWRELW